ncbi:MAG: hypothetical protein LBQ35_06565, partial [Spirochaetaceae bacterium]|nr:hypothetical protein [Spirochaetaceae bacterium]
MKSDFFHSNVPVIPGSRFFLVRPRLDHILEQALESGLTTVTAGPGYGKTQAVSSYLSRTNAVVLWLQVSEQDNLGARFWENLTEVTCSYNYSVGKALQDIGFPVSVRQFDRFRDILSRTMKPDRRYILVFDDCHLLRPGPVLELIERSVVTPPFLHSLVMISRSEPEINTVSLLLKQIISTVTAEDLRFTGEEIAGLYRLLDITLPEEEISAILRDTEGWPISVALLGRELERLDPAERSYLHPRIMERSLERMENDAYESMAPELRKFLLKLSLIQDWAPKLLEALTPDRKLISALEQAAPFIRYDGYRDRYRIHHLFIEFLQEKESELTEDEKLEVYNKAGDWCAENRLSMDAALNYGKGRNYRGLIGVTSSLPRMAPAQTAEFLLNIIDQTIPPGSPVPETEEALLLRYVERSKFLISLRRFSEAADTCREAIELFAG